MSKQLSKYSQAVPYVTKDGSLIRELLHPNLHAVQQQSLAEAVVESGAMTHRHVHQKTEEIYHIIQGRAEVYLDDEAFALEVGDSVCILPGVQHCIKNTGIEKLRFLCCCTPPYAHKDTRLTEPTPESPEG